MNRKAILLHGTGEHPDVLWLPWLWQLPAGRGGTYAASSFATSFVSIVMLRLVLLTGPRTFSQSRLYGPPFADERGGEAPEGARDEDDVGA